MTGDNNFNRPLLYVWQPSILCDSINNSQLSKLENNGYIKTNKSSKNSIIWWSVTLSPF